MITVSKTEFKTTYTAQVRMENGVYVWTTNGRVPPADAITGYGIDKLPGFDKALHDKVRDEQTAQSLAEYRERMKDYVPSAEELAEMRAAFGPGQTVVDVITGRRIQL